MSRLSDAIKRCLETLEILAGEARGLPLVEIAKRLSLPKSNTHRLLGAMILSNFVKQDPLNQHYLLTLRLTTLGFRFLSGTHIIDLCQPVLDRLAERTAELVRMTMTEGERISWVAKSQGSRTGLRFDPEMGREVRIHTTASGRVWLMNQPTEMALRIMMQQGFGSSNQLGPNAPKTVEEFLVALQKTREQGFGLAIDEDEPGMSAIAVPIPGVAGGKPVGTVSVAGPTARLKPETLIGFLDPLRAAASELAGIWSFARLAQDAPDQPEPEFDAVPDRQARPDRKQRSGASPRRP